MVSIGNVLPSGVLSSVADSLNSNRRDRLSYRVMEGGYRRVALSRVDDFELAWLRWPKKSSMPLRGYGGGPARLRVVSGALVEFRFVPGPRGYEFRRLSLTAGMTSELPSGGFHFIVAGDETLALHAYAPKEGSEVTSVRDDLLPRLRDAFYRHVGGYDGPFPPRLLAMLSGARCGPASRAR